MRDLIDGQWRKVTAIDAFSPASPQLRCAPTDPAFDAISVGRVNILNTVIEHFERVMPKAGLELNEPLSTGKLTALGVVSCSGKPSIGHTQDKPIPII
jgi:hypothetical protein